MFLFERDEGGDVPLADERFFRVFMPRELHLVKERASVVGPRRRASDREVFLSLILIRLVTSPPGNALAPEQQESLRRYMSELLNSAILVSDIPGSIDATTYLVIGRWLDADQAHTIARQILTVSTRSEKLSELGLKCRLGYLLYPLSTNPNLPAIDWTMLVEVARRLASLGDDDSASGHGLVRGAEMDRSPTIPESELLDLLLTNIESLVSSKLVELRVVEP